MGYSGKLKEKLLAQKLRRAGYSYKEILLKVKVSKDTISRWCRNIELSSKQEQKLLEKKMFGQKKGSIIAANNKRRLRLLKIKVILVESKRQLGKLSNRDKFIAGIALYAGEGNKTDGQGGFANSDPQLIRFMMSWFKSFCKIPSGKFRGAVWIHSNRDKRKAEIFWSKLTGIPLKQFHKTYVTENKEKSKKVRKNLHQNGIFAIRFSQSQIHRQIIGWIYAMFSDKIPNARLYSDVAQW